MAHHINNLLLQAFSTEGREQLLIQCDEQSLSRGDRICRPGDDLAYVHFIEDGLLSVVQSTGHRELEVGLIGFEGFSGLPAVMNSRQSPFLIFVQSESARVLRVSADVLLAVLGRRDADMAVLRRYCFAFLVQVSANARAAARFTLEQRLARWILMAHDRTDGDEIHMTHQFLASMLGVRRAGVTVATHALEGYGFIRAKRMALRVRDRAGLEAFAMDAYGGAETEYERLIGSAPRLTT
ncbi:Crp/Fnr family transcriptional regulator [Prosthecomicrobium sp. N25]|uniref:Crp/Fnr family transcriptional regulator n=1 Tax=Prosthecomicrobium sp. N25 TaxID=3129254 RepID=UPI0030774339